VIATVATIIAIRPRIFALRILGNAPTEPISACLAQRGQIVGFIDKRPDGGSSNL
jgi:hypothetical protein